MGALKKLYHRISDAIKATANRNNMIQYDGMMGLVSASLIALVELASFFFVPADSVSAKVVFLISAVVMFLQFIGFWVLRKKHYQADSFLLKAVRWMHPYLILLVGVAVCFIYQGYSNQINSFLIAAFAVSFIQIYPLPKRLSVFTFGFLVFNAMFFSVHGFSALFVEGMRFSGMVFLLGYVYSMIVYRAHLNQVETLSQLEGKNTELTDNIQKLNQAHEKLENSQRITEAMMLITTEILKNDHLDDVLQLVLEEAIKLVPQAQAGSILILNGNRMEYRAAFGYDLKKLRLVTLKPEELFQSKQEDLFSPTIIKNLEKFDEGNLNPETFIQLKKSRALVAKAILTCSFRYEGQFLGSINLDNFDSETVFHESDRDMIRHLAKQLEITIAIHKLYEKAVRPTKYDELTQAFTRKHYQELIEKAFPETVKTGKPMAFCTIDLNDFKEINDKFGHETGDYCLRFFADSVRTSGVENMLFARIGGDEFIIAFPENDAIQAAGHIEKIRLFLAQNPFRTQNGSETVTFGCGIAVFPADGKDLGELSKLSDSRMYEDKARIKKLLGTDSQR